MGDIVEFNTRFYPFYNDGTSVSKFIIPIQPKFHDRLFGEFIGRQLELSEVTGELLPERNTIKKAYICHSKNTMIKEGDVIIFYRSADKKRLTAIGTVEKILRTNNTEQIINFVGRRTVYSKDEIKEMAKKQTLVILFSSFLYLNSELSLKKMNNLNILKAAPQSIVKIDDKKYNQIKTTGGLNGRFTFN